MRFVISVCKMYKLDIWVKLSTKEYIVIPCNLLITSIFSQTLQLLGEVKRYALLVGAYEYNQLAGMPTEEFEVLGLNILKVDQDIVVFQRLCSNSTSMQIQNTETGQDDGSPANLLQRQARTTALNRRSGSVI